MLEETLMTNVQLHHDLEILGEEVKKLEIALQKEKEKESKEKSAALWEEQHWVAA